MRILVLDGASAASAGFGLVEHGPEGLRTVLEIRESGQGAAVRLPALVAEALRSSACGAPDLIAALTGPGSFTGLRATLALAHGIAAGLRIPVVGASVGESLGPVLAELADGGTAWCVSQARRDRVFIEAVDRAGSVAAPVAFALDALPDPEGGASLLPPLLAGDAQEAAGAVLAGRGLPWRAGPSRPNPAAIAAAALRRRDGLLAPAEAQPLYVDPPEARPAAVAAAR